MFILNKNTNVIQECNHKDVIKVCKKDQKNYAVAETREELADAAAGLPQEAVEVKAPEENTKEEVKVDSEGTQGGQDGKNEKPEGDGKAQSELDMTWKELPEEDKYKALDSKKVDELRKIAKAEGIQGYGNMNKDTLVAMIMNH